MTISDQELLALLGQKDVELYLAGKANQELAAALKAAKAELERATSASPHQPNGRTAEGAQADAPV